MGVFKNKTKSSRVYDNVVNLSAKHFYKNCRCTFPESYLNVRLLDVDKHGNTKTASVQATLMERLCSYEKNIFIGTRVNILDY